MYYDIVLFTDLGARFWKARALGAYQLATELRRHGYTVKVVDFAGKIFADDKLFTTIVDRLVGPNTIFVGFSTTFFADYTVSSDDTSHLVPGLAEHWDKMKSYGEDASMLPCNPQLFAQRCQYIRNKNPHLKIVAGGSKARSITHTVDYTVVGLADASAVLLADHLKYGKHLPPDAYQAPDNDKQPTCITYDIKGEQFPFAKSITKFEESDHIFPGEVLPVEVSRGCMFRCKFCSYPLLGRGKNSPEYVKHVDCLAEEFRYNYENFGCYKYFIIDDTFNETSQKLQMVLDAQQQAGIQIEFAAYLRIDLIERFPEQIELLKKIGIKSAFFGIESLNLESAQHIGKGLAPERIKDMCYKLKKEWPDVALYGSFIIGLPHDNPEKIQNTMNWLMESDNPLDGFVFNPLYIERGLVSSEFGRNAESYGYVLLPDGWQNDTWNSKEVAELSNLYMSTAYNSGRLKLSNWDIMGIQNFGYDFKDLYGKKLCELPYDQYRQDFDCYFNTYINTLFAYENIEKTT